MDEMPGMTPGFIMDMFGVRARYDARMHGRKRKKKAAMTAAML